MAIPTRPGGTRNAIKRGPGQRIVEGKSFRLADEVRYIQRRATDRDGRIVTIGQLVLFSTETGDAWLLDPADQLAARLAREGENEVVHESARAPRRKCVAHRHRIVLAGGLYGNAGMVLMLDFYSRNIFGPNSLTVRQRY
jgi:hypothetical protein